MAPAGTPGAIIGKLHDEMDKALRAPEVRQLAEKLGLEIVASTPDQLKRHVDSEMARWTKVVKDNNVRPE
jgi:tripartite-type tricarboxylate transporter receptor subunit TctC